eukprot:654062-Amphidinium_carterae.1
MRPRHAELPEAKVQRHIRTDPGMGTEQPVVDNSDILPSASVAMHDGPGICGILCILLDSG